ncbi:MAG TPA: glycine betaine ABC transporter substrate-binding protein [Paenalcaligenes sp.]|nr:glycine betaine ABC transporter substrate-binding protein [Paenalcaligenes sp.]
MPASRVAAFQHRWIASLIKRKTAIQFAVGLVGALSFSNASAIEAATACELDRPIRFVAMDWESNRILLEVERFIVEHGYGCATEAQELDVVKGVQALAEGEADVHTEVWLNSVPVQWRDAEDNNQVKRLGELYLGGAAAFVPEAVKEAAQQAKAQDEPVDQCAAGANCSEDPLAYPDYAVFTGITSQFSVQAPQLSAFFSNVRIQPELMGELLKPVQEQTSTPEEAARQFLQDNEDVWRQWLPMHVTLRVKGAL